MFLSQYCRAKCFISAITRLCQCYREHLVCSLQGQDRTRVNYHSAALLFSHCRRFFVIKGIEPWEGLNVPLRSTPITLSRSSLTTSWNLLVLYAVIMRIARSINRNVNAPVSFCYVTQIVVCHSNIKKKKRWLSLLYVTHQTDQFLPIRL
jgi:hypothetical protein